MREIVYDNLKEDIMSGRINPGERLFEYDLCKRFKSSRTPIREAIRQLQSEKFVRVNSNRGAIVPKLSISEIKEIFDIRAVLESYAIKEIEGKIKKNDLNNIVDIQKKLKRNGVRNDYSSYIENNLTFHLTFAKISGNETLFDIIKNLIMRFNPYTYIITAIPGNLDVWIDEHQQIINALTENNFKEASYKMERHIKNAKVLTVDFFGKR